MSAHERWIRRCLELAARGAGHVSPNPLVGAVLVGPDDAVLGEGWHARYGGPHAEVHAIAEAERQHGAAALCQATLYVNLEPCSHTGKTPPCADLILEKKIHRVVVAMADPFPAVAGKGLARLHEHGVEVITGVLEKEARRLNEAFVQHVATGRPLVTLKIAQTLDGQVATSTGDARWVSGEAARHLTHRWRAELDGILVGRGTARADDPALTVRLCEGRQPVRFVLDRAGTLPSTLQLFTDAFADHTTAVVGEGATPVYEDGLRAAGGRLLHMPVAGDHFDLAALLDRLGRDGGRGGLPLQSLLVEAGPGLATALFRHGLVDRFFAFIAPKLVGAGTPSVSSLGVARMADALTFSEHCWEAVGDDLLFRGYRNLI